MQNRKTRKSFKRILIGFALSALLVSNIILWAAHIATMTPYAITSDDGVVCCVRGRETARDVLGSVFSSLAKKGTNLSAISSGYYIEKSDGTGEILSSEEAQKAVLKSAAQGEAEIRIVSSKIETKPYTPEPEYEMDNTMLAGQSEILSEGSNGEKKVDTAYVTVNGKTKEKNEVDKEILTEGTPAVIAKGTLGLPDGEQWQHYEGYPVCKNGSDIIQTAQNYLGLKYVWAGKNLETGVDCSGFVIAIYRKYGVNLTYPLYKEGIGVPYSEAQPGDILYFPGHYGLYLGDGLMVHASSSAGKVVIGGIGNRKILAVRRIVQE